MSKERVFLDANILYSAAYWPEAWFLVFWKHEGLELVSSEYAVAEARRNLETVERKQRLRDLAANVRRASPSATLVIDLGLDVPGLVAKDLEILAAAVETQAQVLVTADENHFGPLFGRTIRGVRIEHVFTYLKKLKRSGR